LLGASAEGQREVPGVQGSAESGQVNQSNLFEDARMKLPELSITPEVTELIAKGSPVAIGVSGGKDSCAVAFAFNDYLDAVGHKGERILIHSDLGRTEWKDSLPTCERLAKALNLELVVVRRESGDMLARWQQRWRNNVTRYQNLECVKLILPWSTPSMRFCTSELKTAIISRYLAKRFKGQAIISANGIRREESPNRAKSPIYKSKEANSTTTIIDYHPILDFTKRDVFALLNSKAFPLHEAYTVYGTTRVSCCYCIMSSLDDLIASSQCPDNQDVYREMVHLEIESTFSFQSNQWLGDIKPDLLTGDSFERLAFAKQRASARERIESRIPKHMLYVKGWPVAVPTYSEAEMLAEIRLAVAELLGIPVAYTDPVSIIDRYEELMAVKPVGDSPALIQIVNSTVQPLLMSLE
jgi:3'-phosphoadenosine 5'-phosphosulfate sulfotransferase (PAPS reductase)/FAD synthetase